MRVVGTLFFSLAVLVNSIGCPGLRMTDPILTRPRTIRASAKELDNLYYMTEDHRVHQVQDHLSVVAKGFIIIGWNNNGLIYPICNSEGHITIQYIESKMQIPISDDQAKLFGGVYVPDPPQVGSPSGSRSRSPQGTVRGGQN